MNEMTTEIGTAIGATLVEEQLPDIDGLPADNWFHYVPPSLTYEKKQKIISGMPTYDCCTCRKSCRGYGNNAEPVKEGRCCARCNEIVIRARIIEMRR